MFGGSQLDSFSGGGFMPSQSTQGSDPSRTSAKSRDNPHLLPLTVKQISQAIQSSDEKSNFVIDGVDVNNKFSDKWKCKHLSQFKGFFPGPTLTNGHHIIK
ncbi:replication protein A 32 kDa subunit A-like [Nicotiana tabacum]|uniref:Replication protein A 32 kDa subunit A-like n=1 Tax=Nicotiana tabacum TaxID=4097 RepID=A0A1S3X583_TOBAC|nr:replication protein A 32 kDa subunit A-like [Nicotiana tomentosiformis]XP_016435145.1 PREDICTED: replication protein A 32 kDa subunit A-like [Nicotiana tabacum]